MRVTVGEVGEIIEVDPGIPLNPFLAASHAMVEQACSELGYTEPQLKNIELWLSAHFYTVRDPRTTKESAGSVSVTFQSVVKEGLKSSVYGQTALSFDFLGGLIKLQSAIENSTAPLTVGITHLGSSEEDIDELH